ncbi:hypothetical protein [Aureimonas sp. ME7]|uniref:hypothetical protein n=1 Tax=Aureimonas sp. ME7 TaxID=2744252 RepID=UPI0015F60154|nr:hypothetical protein [Aureimonas sp. ME7]
MIKLLGIGVWVCLVTLGSGYAVANLAGASASEAPKAPDYFEGLDYKKTDSIAVPVIAENAIQGYVMARFVYTIDGETASKLAVPPEPIILDQAFKTVYSVSDFDFQHPERYDLSALMASLRDGVNAKYGRKVVEEVMVDQFDFLPKNQIGGEAFKTH